MKRKIAHFFKTGILLFGVSFTLLNCENQEENLELNQNSKYIEKAKNYFNNLSLTEHQQKLLSLSESINWNNSQTFKKENDIILEIFLNPKKTQSLKSYQSTVINFHNRILFSFNKNKGTTHYFVTVISPLNSLNFISNKENIRYSNISKEFSGSIIVKNKEDKSFINEYINGVSRTKPLNLYTRVEPQERCYQIVERFSDGSVRVVPNSRFCLGYSNDNNYGDGYHGGGGNSNGNNGNATDDKIDASELTDKAKCVYEKMIDSKGNINWILKNFKDGHKPSEFDLKFVMATDLPNNVNGRTLPVNNNTVIIKINSNTISSRTNLEVARTILHEGIHARLEEFAKRKGSNATDFPGIYDYYRRNNKNTWSHQQMAAHYITTIAGGLKQFDNGQHTGQFYRDMAWNGLYNISNGSNNPPILTDAWNTLSSSEKTRIKNVIKNEHINGNKNCN